MNYKFYKVTQGVFIDRVNEVRLAQNKSVKQINLFKDEVGAKEVARWSQGGVAYFTFDGNPDIKLWKKAHDGFMPRRGNKEGKALSDKLRCIPPFENLQVCLDVLGLGDEMVMGESRGSRFTLHSSSFCGVHESKTYFIKVPQEKGQEHKHMHDDLIECKEWEMLKFMDE